MLGADRDPVVIDQMLVPPESWGVRCISIGYFVPEGQAVIWRGPMLHKALEQFLTDVFWDEPDFLLIDMPPGTGDIALVAQPVPAPRRGVRRHHAAAGRAEGRPRCRRRWPRRSTCPCKGVIENMSWFTGDDGKRYEIFGAAAARSSPTSSACRCSASCRWCRRSAKAATTAVRSPPSIPTARRRKAFHEIARKIAVELKPKKVFSAALRVN